MTEKPAPKRRSTRVPAGPPLAPLIDSWELALKVNRAPKTIRGYIDTARAFVRWLDAHGHPTDAETVAAAHVRAFLIAEIERTSAVSADCHFRYLRVWFNWLAKEGERTRPSPVDPDDRPKVPEKVEEYLTDEEQAQLLKTCTGSDFESRRDRAIFMILIDNGMRVRGLGDIRVADVNLKTQTIKIVLKGGDELLAPIGVKTCQAIDRYLRIRAGHPHAASPWLWLGLQGHDVSHFTHEGIRAMLKRRGKRAGVRDVHPHRFRAKATHALLAAGATEGAVQRILGWKTRTMVDHYSRRLAAERARESHARYSPADRF